MNTTDVTNAGEVRHWYKDGIYMASMQEFIAGAALSSADELVLKLYGYCPVGW